MIEHNLLSASKLYTNISRVSKDTHMTML
ncbi:unnamed protein product [Linum tenue]|uniref:Uncharacterized protein n=1 Tax=Linum tenue TaxID=586396 RepID=A0AAV0LGV3_9ROSI|nr:unnamed protein product [Linum tenue]